MITVKELIEELKKEGEDRMVRRVMIEFKEFDRMVILYGRRQPSYGRRKEEEKK